MIGRASLIGEDRGLKLATGLALGAAALAALFTVVSLPRPLVLVMLAAAIAAAGASLVLAIRAARRQQARAQRYRELLAQAAHQLRTPNATLTLELDGARLDPQLGEAGRALVDRLSAQVDAQNALVTRLLAYARLDLRDDPVEEREAADLVEDAARVLRPVAEAHDVELIVAAEPGAVRGRLLELRELIVILGENAILHGTGAVRISVAPSARSTVIEVANEGERGGGERAGAGIGLQLAERIVARHGGRLSLDVQDEDGARRTVARAVIPRRKLRARRGF